MRAIGNAARILVVLALLANLASAAVHTWRVDEIYSNASGSVQFVEMTTPFDGENFFSSYSAALNAKNPAGATQNSYNFNANLVGSTAGKTILIGTANLTAQSGVTPDFVVPPNFLLTTGGKLEFASPVFGGQLDIDNFPSFNGS